MTQNTPVPADEVDDAIDALQKTFRNHPENFLNEFKLALSKPTLNFMEKIDGSVGSKWAEAYAGSMASNASSAKVAANAILGNASTSAAIKKLNSKSWFYLVEALFPYFDLPRGWLQTALNGGLQRGHIQVFLMSRVRAITPKTADAERDFLRMLLSRPPRPNLGYRTVLSEKERDNVLKIVQEFAPDILHDTKTDTVAWRIKLR